MFLITTALAFDVTLSDPGTLGAEWSAEIQAQSTESSRTFLAFVGQGAVEQAFSLQHAPSLQLAGTSPNGFSLGIELDTFPLRKPPVNGQGKSENTQFSPVAPRITLGWAESRGRFFYAASTSLVPPVEVAGASAFLIGGDFSASIAVTPTVLIGGMISWTAGQAYAPVVATPEARATGVLENVNEERYEAICVPQEFGCIDSLLIRHGGAHLIASFLPDARIQPYARAGATLISDRFLIQVDLSDWRMKGILAEFGAGANYHFNEHFSAGLGIQASPLPEATHQEGEFPLLYRFSLGGALTF